MIRTEGQFRYVPHHKVEDYFALGWMILNDMQGTHHGRHAVIMWRCDCD